jgi:hypothetical protein
MLATAHVNVNYLLILLVPSVGVLLVMALTWRSRTRHQRESEAKLRRPPSAKQRSSSSAKRRSK